ncbi:MAG: helix-turn-helix domain-containing protein [Chitinivibrionales bacterium]|nr:helix-turn-helix domain-containing protein [Chitinivibrionales bacterium]MBD3395688.1 helix-turn-helix domain-containing protein [Chitinivibrionales bacterium]
MANHIFIHVISDHRRRAFRGAYENLSPYYNVEGGSYVPPLTIVASGSSHWGMGHSYHRDRCDLLGVELMLAGTGFFIQDGRRYELGPGDVFILRPGCAHTYGTGSSGYLLKRHVTLQGTGKDQLLHVMGLAGRDFVRPLAPRSVATRMKEANRLLTARPAGFALRLSHVAYETLTELSRSTYPQYPPPMRAAVEFIQQNLNRPVSAGEICRRAGLSQTHLNRLFRKHAGNSPVRYHLRERFAWARHILRETAQSIKEISAIVGYDDPLYFSSQFKKHVGISPKHYRRQANRT